MATRGRKPGSLVRGTCIMCKTVELTAGSGGSFRCTACKAAGLHPYRGSRHVADILGQEVASLEVQRAIRDGDLPSASACQCVDCGAQAHDYDHRDYARPLAVDPTCRRCNLLRGPAKPVDGWLAKCVIRGLAPYRLKRNAERVLALCGMPTHVVIGMPRRINAEHWQLIARRIDALAHS